MASPQLKKGYLSIANESIEALSAVKMSGTEWQYLMCLFRKTYGYHKKEDWITNTQVMKMTGLKKERVSEAKSRLLARNIVTEKRNNISYQKDYEKWIVLRKSVTIVTEKRNKVLRKSVPTKDRKIKDTSQTSLTEELKANQEEVMWNKKSDDFEEDPIQTDPDHKAKKAKKQGKASEDQLAVFELFSNPAKALWRMRELERVSAQTLFETYGLDTLKKRIDRIDLEKKKKDPFLPQVDTPSELLDKMPKIERYLNV